MPVLLWSTNIEPKSFQRNSSQVPQLGALSHLFFGWKGSPTQRLQKKGTLILNSLLEDLVQAGLLKTPWSLRI